MTLSCGDVYRIIPQILGALEATARSRPTRVKRPEGVRAPRLADGGRPAPPRCRRPREADAAARQRGEASGGAAPAIARRARHRIARPDEARPTAARRDASRARRARSSQAADRARKRYERAEVKRFTRRARRRRIGWLVGRSCWSSCR